MGEPMLYRTPEWLILLLLLACLVTAAELGFRAGDRRARLQLHDATRTQVGNIQTMLLGLVALLIAFTFAMALGRFDDRRSVLVREVNAIGTALLRCDLLPSGAELRPTFRRYVRNRLEATTIPSTTSERIAHLDAEAAQLQDTLWKAGVTAARESPQPLLAVQFVQAMNELIDSKGARDASLAHQVPQAVLWILFAFSALAVSAVGFGNGLVGRRAPGATIILAALLAVVVMIIVDVDRPRRGVIQIDQTSMFALEQSLAK
jgi:hypothetical protein